MQEIVILEIYLVGHKHIPNFSAESNARGFPGDLICNSHYKLLAKTTDKLFVVLPEI